MWLVAGAVVLAVLLAIFVAGGGQQGAERYSYAVGNPGPGEPAPALRLPATDGSTFDMADLRGKRVLLYFQEGIMCQPCWDQLRDIERRWDDFDAAGIDTIASITSDDLGALRQKVALEKLSTPLLSDPGVQVSRNWEVNLYGMMGTSMNGHSLIVVGPDGTVEWRADYGGKPNYTMYVPVDRLLSDLRAGLAKGDAR
ncbi:MAG: peroxiredoxin family protein [Actinomycetota bacterium]